MAAIIRLKRKACDEPADGLLIAVKRSKHELSDTNEVLFKFAATLKNETESMRDQIQAALCKENTKKFTKWRDPKNIAVSESTVKKLNEKIRTERKNSIAKKKLDLLNNRRLILSEEFQNFEEDEVKDAEVRHLFHLYDIIEENEDFRKQNEEAESIITCNDTPLVREKFVDYVFDVYIADRQIEIDKSFVDRTISIMPCTLTEDDIYFGDTDDSEEYYEDDDDSNDENNWRNEYPDDADSPSDKGSDSDTSGSDSYVDANREVMRDAFKDFDIGDDSDEVSDDLQGNTFEYSRIMKELSEECEED